MRILIIEDDADLQLALASALEAAAFAVDKASDGERGSYLARINDYDLVVLDFMMPKKNGDQVCREIRAAGKEMPILMLSVRDGADQKATLLNEGVDDYLGKPFSTEELMARIRALLRRPKRIESPVIMLGNITIDGNRQTVYCGSKHVYLTRKEFSLLEYLARNRGLVVSRGMLLEHVWNMDSDPFSNTIEAHIVNLRKKLGPGGRKLIATIPGRGYRIEEAA